MAPHRHRVWCSMCPAPGIVFHVTGTGIVFHVPGTGIVFHVPGTGIVFQVGDVGSLFRCHVPGSAYRVSAAWRAASRYRRGVIRETLPAYAARQDHC